ncbi:type VII secretion-associated serine protease mycosin [Hoyosella sp. YIM 151337]|uniref:type VII secretion-associated serine protease mycosin n=1 Tax=Hoyosella sp. YIM 151337 TaxID=2992742 RepID=UPI0022361EDD|nr:type VII secretion-associated serine protease mycosin [Hoyosella sp. YIM 151337]MCW4352530.1 type VII secretion-associated serine protease mycosin [Hoyosella sp. YIM 151337]
MRDRYCAPLIAALLIVAVVLGPGAGVATASPPPVDDTFLPPAGAAGPLDVTDQREACSRAVADPRFGSLNAPSGAGTLNFATVWPITRGGGQLVAIIDTGVTPHPRLRDVIAGGDYVSSGDGLHDCDAHGTFVAGIIAAQPSTADGFTGVAPDARILAIRQSSLKFSRGTRDAGEYQSENSYGSIRTLAMAVRRAADLGATVINISEVGCASTAAGFDDRALGAALRYAVEVKDAVVVAAAGNVGATGPCREQNPPPDPLGSGQPDWDSVRTVATPAWYSTYVLTVGSVDPDGAPSDFSLGGPWVDVAAPGTGIVSLDAHPGSDGLVNAIVQSGDGGESMGIAGTSYAAPYVSGTAALVRARFPHLNAREVMDRLTATAHPPAHGWDPYVGHGVIDPVAAVTADLDPSGTSGSRGFAVAPARVSGPPGREPAVMTTPEAPPASDPLPATIAGTLGLGSLVVTTVFLLGRFPRVRRQYR